MIASCYGLCYRDSSPVPSCSIHLELLAWPEACKGTLLSMLLTSNEKVDGHWAAMKQSPYTHTVCWWFRIPARKNHRLDVQNPGHTGINTNLNWCMISSINRMIHAASVYLRTYMINACLANVSTHTSLMDPMGKMCSCFFMSKCPSFWLTQKSENICHPSPK